MTLQLSLHNSTDVEDIEPWMLGIAKKRGGMYKITVNNPNPSWFPCLTQNTLSDCNVVVNMTGEEFSTLDKVIMNQVYAGAKDAVRSTIVFQRAATLWPSHKPDHIAMRTLGPWAISQYRCNGSWRERLCCFNKKNVRLECRDIPPRKASSLSHFGMTPKAPEGAKPAPPKELQTLQSFLEEAPQGGAHQADANELDNDANLLRRSDSQFVAGDAPLDDTPVDGLLSTNGFSGFLRFLATEVAPDDLRAVGPTTTSPPPGLTEEQPAPVGLPTVLGPRRNDLGYVVPGDGNLDIHELGSAASTKESEMQLDALIRADRDDRVLVNDAGVGVIGQSTTSDNPKQIVGVLTLPTSCPPNVYAVESENIESAIANRITAKKRPVSISKEDKRLIGRVVAAAIGEGISCTTTLKKRSLFRTRAIVEWWQANVFSDLKSGKWSEERLNNAVLQLCHRVDPSFRLTCSIKKEGMPEGKAPRMLIADGDEGQVMSLLTICCIEDLIKKHMPNRTIKGVGKRAAMERIAKELRVPKAAFSATRAKDMCVFEGDGSAWDTTCGVELRACVENPIIEHVAGVLCSIMAQPASWVNAHTKVCELKELKMAFKRNNVLRRYVIDAIRRSGHRGTSALNWWVNHTVWHCAVFKEPERFLDPGVRYGKDHEDTYRWLASGFEGDDSLLSTTPAIREGGTLHTQILQFWERLGFNMKIHIRENRALFTGYYLALDESGPTGVMMPEVDRCFSRAGVSCSPKVIECFLKNDRSGCKAIARAASLSRAYEFAGLSPTISGKFLAFYESLGGKTLVDRDLCAKTCGVDADFVESDIVSEIRVANGVATTFDDSEHKRFTSVGFKCSAEELAKFEERPWDYDLLRDYEGFCESLPQSWRQA